MVLCRECWAALYGAVIGSGYEPTVRLKATVWALVQSEISHQGLASRGKTLSHQDRKDGVFCRTAQKEIAVNAFIKGHDTILAKAKRDVIDVPNTGLRGHGGEGPFKQGEG